MKLTVEHINRALEIVRGQTNPKLAWDEVLLFGSNTAPSGLWPLLPHPDIEKDVVAATAWLSSQIISFPNASGIYLGLDTLNMGDGDGMNIGIGGTSKCDATKDEIDWVYSGLNYGKDHLIYGLFPMKQVYSKPEWKDFCSFADYILFLAYSGIILGQALMRLPTKQTFLAVWGFHDGDLFLLGRKAPEKFDFIQK